MVDPNDVEGAVPLAEGKFELSVERMPRVNEFFHCALPILHLDDENGAWHGVGGTAFFVRYRGRVFAVTAGHCVRDASGSSLAVATVTEAGPLKWIRTPEILRTPTLDPSSPYTEETDVAILVPEREPEPEEVRILDLEDNYLVDLRKWEVGGVVAASGFPRTGAMRYGEDGGGVYASVHYFAIGQYGGTHTSLSACHIMLTRVPPEGPDGMSGSPVACCRIEDDGTWTPGFAGMVLMGGLDRLHFLDGVRLLGYVRAAVRLLQEQPRGFEPR